MHTHSTTPTTQQLKTCTKCGESFPATTEFFYSAKKNGLTSRCKNCARKASRTWYQTNRDRGLESRRAYYQANKEKLAEARKAWYQDNRDKRIKQAAAWAEVNRDRTSRYKRKWEKANPEAMRVKARRRRAWKRNAPGSHTAEDIQSLYAAQEGRCAYCGVEVGESYHVDHIVPLSRGGGNGVGNLAIACQPCNQAKGSKLLEEWRAEG